MTGALVAIQLDVNADVLGSAETYRAHLEAACVAAIAAAGPADARLVVFPELAGHLALYALAPPAARRARNATTLAGALAIAAARRPLDVLRGIVTTRLLDARHAVLAALAPDGERWWRGVFGPLARRHAAFVVAGSHLRLGPSGDLTNASLLFGPDGRLLATTDKVNLVPGMEDGARGGLALARGRADALPIAETALGSLATAICYDGFCEPHTRHERFVAVTEQLAARGGVAIIANPAANPWPWLAPWPPPRLADARAAFPTRADQWAAEGLAGSLARWPAARYGVTAHLVGGVLDLAFAGASEIVERTPDGTVRSLARAPAADRAACITATISC